MLAADPRVLPGVQLHPQHPEVRVHSADLHCHLPDGYEQQHV